MTTLTSVELDRERLARIAMTQVIEPGSPVLDDLMQTMTAAEVLDCLVEGDGIVGDWLLSDVQDDLDQVGPQSILEEADKAGFRYVIPGDEEWPTQLGRLAGKEPVQDTTGAPLGLWVRGARRLDDLDTLTSSYAVVGSRDATAYGSDVAAGLAGDLARTGHAIVSGGSVGIDAAAHRGALAANGRTVVVLAGGLDRPWPTENERLFDAITETGALVSEYAPATPVTRRRFLARNRVVAALAPAGTVLIEAPLRSGALNTTLWTRKIGAPLMAVPGPVTETGSKGPNQLIRDGVARLVTCAGDVREEIDR